MGFLDRFSRASSPDALTVEVAARLRAFATVDAADIVDADTVSVVWSGHEHPVEIDLAPVRAPWKQARGFDRIELLDDFMAGLRPDDPLPTTADPVAVPEATPAGTTGTGDDLDATGFAAVRTQLFPVVRAVDGPDDGLDDGAVRWPIDGVFLEATVVVAGDGHPITASQCAAWGVEEAAIRDTAVGNQSAIDPAPDPIAPDARAWVPTDLGGLASSWLAAPGRLLERTGLESGIVLVPLVGELVVVDPDDTDLVLSILSDTLAILEDQTDTLCPVPFLVTAHETTTWTPANDHPAAPLVQRTREMFR